LLPFVLVITCILEALVSGYLFYFMLWDDLVTLR